MTGTVKWFNGTKVMDSLLRMTVGTFSFISQLLRWTVSRPLTKDRESNSEVEDGPKGPQAAKLELRSNRLSI